MATVGNLVNLSAKAILHHVDTKSDAETQRLEGLINDLGQSIILMSRKIGEMNRDIIALQTRIYQLENPS